MADFDLSSLFTDSAKKPGRRGRPRKSQEADQQQSKNDISKFKHVATNFGLSSRTIDVLEHEEFNSFGMITIMTEGDISNLDISGGQKALLRKWITDLNANPSSQSQSAFKLSQDEVAAQMSAAGIGLQNMDSWTADQNLLLDGKNLHLLNIPLKDKVKRKLQRPHEFIPAKKGLADLSLLELLYGNLLIIENAVIDSSDEVLALTRHVSFLLLKAIQFYSPRSIIEYDYALRQKLEVSSESWPIMSDVDLCNRYLKLNSNYNRHQSASILAMENLISNLLLVRFHLIIIDVYVGIRPKRATAA